jgi:hypothetical protein
MFQRGFFTSGTWRVAKTGLDLIQPCFFLATRQVAMAQQAVLLCWPAGFEVAINGVGGFARVPHHVG